MKKGIDNNSDVQVIIGRNIQEARQNMKLTRKAFCEIVNTSDIRPMRKGEIDALDENRLKQWEYGNNPVDINWIPALCEVLSVDVGYLFGDYKEHTREFSDIAAFTGLSETAISTLKVFVHNDIKRGFVDNMICSYSVLAGSSIAHAVNCQENAVESSNFNQEHYHFAESLKKAFSRDQSGPIQVPDGVVPLEAGIAAKVYIEMATNDFREFLTKYVKETADKHKNGGIKNGEH